MIQFHCRDERINHNDKQQDRRMQRAFERNLLHNLKPGQMVVEKMDLHLAKIYTKGLFRLAA